MFGYLLLWINLLFILRIDENDKEIVFSSICTYLYTLLHKFKFTVMLKEKSSSILNQSGIDGTLVIKSVVQIFYKIAFDMIAITCTHYPSMAAIIRWVLRTWTCPLNIHYVHCKFNSHFWCQVLHQQMLFAFIDFKNGRHSLSSLTLHSFLQKQRYETNWIHLSFELDVIWLVLFNWFGHVKVLDIKPTPPTNQPTKNQWIFIFKYSNDLLRSSPGLSYDACNL